MKFAHQRPRHLAPTSIADEDGNGHHNLPYLHKDNDCPNNDSGCFTFSLVHGSLMAVITALFTHSPFLHLHSYHFISFLSTFTPMSRLTQGLRNPCTWQLRLLCSTTLRTANLQEQMGRGSSSKKAQAAYNESNCIHTVSGFFVNTTQSPYRRCVLLQAKTLVNEELQDHSPYPVHAGRRRRTRKNVFTLLLASLSERHVCAI